MSEPRLQVVFRTSTETGVIFREIQSRWRHLAERHGTLLFWMAVGAPPILALLWRGNTSGAIASGLVLLMPILLTARVAKRLAKEAKADMRELTLHVSPEGLRCSSADGWTVRAWSGVEGVQHVARHLLIRFRSEVFHDRLNSNNNAFVIPQEAFPTHRALDEFAAAVQHYLDDPSGGSLAALVPADDDDPTAMEVTYRNSPAECADIDQRKARWLQAIAVAPPKEPGGPAAPRSAQAGRQRVGRALSYAVVIGGILLFYLASHNKNLLPNWVPNAGRGLLFFAFVVTVEFFVLARAISWAARRRTRRIAFPQTTLRIGPNGLLLIGEHSVVASPWKDVRAVWPAADGVGFLNHFYQIACFVPLASFANAHQFELFARQAEQYRGEDAARREAEGEELPRYGESGNPYQSPVGGF